MPAQPVFVYGTLRRGERNHGLLGDAQRILPGWLDDHALHGHHLPFPYVTPAPGSRVRGELVWPADGDEERLLARLDALEGFAGDGEPANHYDRVVRTCCLAPATGVRAWVYLAGPAARVRLAAGPDRVVATGDWHDAERRG